MKPAGVGLAALQQGLQDIYELNVGHDVSDFVITSRELALALEGAQAPAEAREKLLVREDAEGLRLSLYLDAQVMANLDEAGRGDAMDNLNDRCLVLEGVSHFLFLVWNAMHERPVAPFDMELQAEVDKYVMLRGVLAAGEQERVSPAELLKRLFRSVAFRDDLKAAELQRYRDASRYAEQYCRRLEADYFSSGKREDGLNELRRFYRLPRGDKLRRAGCS